MKLLYNLINICQKSTIDIEACPNGRCDEPNYPLRYFYSSFKNKETQYSETLTKFSYVKSVSTVTIYL